MKRWVLIAVGIPLTLIGIVFTGQGAGWITGSFMTGAKLWFFVGLVCLIAGVGLVVTGIRKARTDAG